MNYTIIRTLSIVFQIHVFAFNEGEMVVLWVEWRKREYSIVSFIFKMYVRICIYIIKKKKKQPERKRLDGGIVDVWLFFFLETLVFSKFTTITQLLL